jgi:hypothetical protein
MLNSLRPRGGPEPRIAGLTARSCLAGSGHEAHDLPLRNAFVS